MGPHELSIRSHLADYLDGRMSLAEFTDWMVGAVWEIERYGEPNAAALGYAIELALAEQTSGLWNQAELGSELRRLAFPGVTLDARDGLPPRVSGRRRNIA